MIALALPEGIKMTAIITSTSETNEARIVSEHGDTVATTYHDTLEAALNHAAKYQPAAIEFEELSI